MPTLTDLLGRHLEGVLLVFFRMGAMMSWAPVLGHRTVPVPHRAGLALVLAVVVAPVLAPGSVRPGPAADLIGWILAVAGEILIGLAIGFVAHLAISAVQVAGELIGLEMGLSIATVFDPVRGEQDTIVARFLYMVALLLFLAVNGHHVLIRAVAHSVSRIEPGTMFDRAAAGGMVALGGKVIQSGLALAAPLMAVLVVVNILLALLGRAVPQTNVFLLGLPLSIGLGLLALFDELPAFMQGVGGLVGGMRADLDTVLMGVRHGR
jgi:flagellar biosynthetic protein FliR